MQSELKQRDITTNMLQNRPFRDMLMNMFEMQRSLQVKIGVSEDAQTSFVNSVAGLVCELGEVMNEYEDWKNWKRRKKKVDRSRVLEELVDAWHFMINLTMSLGIGPEELYTEFVEKNAVNHQRQENGY